MSCTPCTPPQDEFPIFCDPNPATDVGQRLLVEDEAFCTKALVSPETGSTLVWEDGIKWKETDPPEIPFDETTPFLAEGTTEPRNLVTRFADIDKVKDFQSYNFLATGTTESRNLVTRFADIVNVKDFGAVGDGVTDDTAAIQAWWDYILSKLDNNETQVTPAIAGYVPSGTYNSTSGLILEANKYRIQVFGDGWNSRFNNVAFNVTYPFFQLKNIAISGTTGVTYGVAFNKNTTTSFNPNGSALTNLYIRDRDFGIQINSGAPLHVVDSYIHRCNIGIRVVGGAMGQNIINTEVQSSITGGVLINGGGETKFDHVRILNSGLNKTDGSAFGLKIQRDDTVATPGTTVNVIPNESYFYNSTITQSGGMVYDSITSIASYDGGSRIKITTSSPHELADGIPAKLKNTGITSYDNVQTYVYAVLSDFEAVLAIPYNGGTTGSIETNGYDLIIESAVNGTTNGILDNKNMHFVGGNINLTKIAGAFNVQFTGVRLTEKIFLAKSSLGEYNSQIAFFRAGPSGEYARFNSGAPSSERVKEIPISGPGSVKGWMEVCATDKNKGGWGAGGEVFRMRTPLNGTTLLPNRTPAIFSEIAAGEQGTTIDGYPASVKFTLSNDSATYYYIPSGNTAAMISILTYSSNEPFLTASGTARLDSGTTPEATKDSGGTTLEVDPTGGPLNGTTGNVGKVTIRANTLGRFYIENRTGGAKDFIIKYIN